MMPLRRSENDRTSGPGSSVGAPTPEAASQHMRQANSVNPPGRSGRPLAVTSDEAILDALLRVGETCGVELEVAPDVCGGRRSWASAPLVLVGADMAGLLARSMPTRRRGVVVVTVDRLDAVDPLVWQRSVELGVEEVLSLPDQEAWLAERLADVVDGSAQSAVTVCVLGGRGGAGASSLAVALALTATRSGLETILIDGDPMGGGLDLAMGGEHTSGVRWQGLFEADGRIGPRALSRALPRIEGVRVISFDGDGGAVIPQQAMRSVLASCRRAADLVVIDLPRHIDPATEEALGQASTVLIVIPEEVRAVAAARRLAGEVTRIAADVRLVVRGPAPGGLTPAEIIAAVGLPLAGEIRPESTLAPSLERGEPPGSRGKGPLVQFSRRLLRQLGLGPRRTA